MAKKYGVTAYRATKYLRDEQDCFTAQLIPMWDSRSKSKVIDELVAEYDLDLSASYAYGDTNGDLSMLQRVGNPTALNPSYRLLELIRNEKELADRVNIVVERKDVAYHVRGDVYAESTLLAHEMDDKKE